MTAEDVARMSVAGLRDVCVGGRDGGAGLRRFLRFVVPFVILVVAAVFRVVGLGYPQTLVFDEAHYVRDAISQNVYGYPGTWADDGVDLRGDAVFEHSSVPGQAVHPPLGKWLIGVGIVFFGPGDAFGWRISSAVAGVLCVALTMVLGFVLTGVRVCGWIAGALLALDGVHITLSRVALLDVFLTLLVVAGALFYFLGAGFGGGCWGARRGSGGGWLRRFVWLLLAGVFFGLAAGVKWSGVFPLVFLTGFSFCLMVLRGRDGLAGWAVWRRGFYCLFRDGVTVLPAALFAYVCTWFGWLFSVGGLWRVAGEPVFVSLWRYHLDMFDWHGGLSSAHPYAAHPLSWLLGLRPTGMYEARWPGCGGECVSFISSLPNVFVTWGGVLALLFIAFVLVFRLVDVVGSVFFGVVGGRMGAVCHVFSVFSACFARFVAVWREVLIVFSPFFVAAAFVLACFLSGFLPWLVFSARSHVFQFYAVVLTPFSAVAFSLVATVFLSLRGVADGFSASLPVRFAGRGLRVSSSVLLSLRLSASIFFVLAFVVTVLFWPLYSGLPVPDWFFYAHLWLPGWV